MTGRHLAEGKSYTMSSSEVPITSSTAAATRKRPDSFRFVRWPLAAALLLSSILKTIEFLKSPPRDRLSTVLFVIGFAWLAVWLLTGLARRTAWCITLVVFSGLASFIGWQLYLGNKSCGCFGELHPPLPVIFTFDTAAVLGLLVSWPAAGAALSASRREIGLIGAGAVIAGVALGGYMLAMR